MQSEPRGRAKVAVPVSLGMLNVAAALPQFLCSWRANRRAEVLFATPLMLVVMTLIEKLYFEQFLEREGDA